MPERLHGSVLRAERTLFHEMRENKGQEEKETKARAGV
jgi:hypothetical protein